MSDKTDVAVIIRQLRSDHREALSKAELQLKELIGRVRDDSRRTVGDLSSDLKQMSDVEFNAEIDGDELELFERIARKCWPECLLWLAGITKERGAAAADAMSVDRYVGDHPSDVQHGRAQLACLRKRIDSILAVKATKGRR